MPENWGGYQQPMPYPPPNNHNLEQPFMYPYHYQDTGGYMTPYHDPYQQAAYHPFQPVPQQAMPVGAYPGNSVMQPMAQMQPIQSNLQPQAFSPFANPLQPAKRPPQSQQQAHNPYPKQQFMQKPQPSGFKSVMNQFKTQDGSMDITKMMNTAGQMMNTVSQVSSMVKGVGGFFKA
ncbi:hypothetical protein H7F28_21425 [Brevibacterium sp. PAMC23299]|nr:hypothetical protein H7F28_21425 [Brevibacterium sp. PAMC23299]